MTKINDYNLL